MTMDDEKLYRITPTQQMLSSCTGALLTSLLVTPLDVVKIRLQSQQKIMLSNKCFVYCNGLMDHLCHCINGTETWIKRPGHFNSTIDAFSKIVKTEGITSLWSGLPPTLIMAVPATIVYFVTYEQLRSKLKDNYNDYTHTKGQPLWIPLLSGGLARTWAVTLINPLELVRTKLQSQRLKYSQISVACKELYKGRGIRGFWLGWAPSIMRDVPFSALYWGSYETLKKMTDHEESPPIGASFLFGAISGIIAGTLTLPFDVVKTHRQVELGELIFGSKGENIPTIKDTLTRIYKRSGIRGLFTGIVPRLTKIAPACAIMISSYEIGKSYFSNYNREHYTRQQ